jgi:hypothetical protein
MKTRLIALYWDAAPARQAEVGEALWNNVQNPDIDEVVLIVSKDTKSRLPESEKLRYIQTDSARPTYGEIFNVANSLLTSPHDRTIVINSDCFFDAGDLAKLNGADWRQFMFVVTRRDVGTCSHGMWFTGQDVWIFTGHIRPMKWLDFSPGCLNCDWVLAWLARHAGYSVVNLADDIRLWHLHKTNIRNYGTKVHPPGHLNIGMICEVPPTRLHNLRKPEQVQTGIMSYSLYGKDPMYVEGAFRNAEAIRHIYPGFIARFYVDDTVDPTVVRRLKDLLAEVIEVPRGDNHEGMRWRLKALEEKGVDFVGIRDADSRLTLRDHEMFDQWVSTGLDYHIVRDHPHHRNAVILSCFNSRKPFSLPTMDGQGAHYNNDEQYFASKVVPLLGESVGVHDYDGSGPNLPGVRLEPPPRSKHWNYYVGAKIWPDEGFDPCTAEGFIARQ